MKLHYTRQASRELREILVTIARQSPQGARRIQADLRVAIETLRAHPLSGPLTDVPGLRRYVVRPYILFYTVGSGELVIGGIRHAARDPRTMPGR